jgi:hypothetical protein
MRSVMRGAVLGLLAVWTVHWFVDGWAYLQEHSIVVQQGFGSDGVQLWEVFNIKMVAAHHAVRWLAGVAVGLVALHLLRRRAPGAGAAGSDTMPDGAAAHG